MALTDPIADMLTRIRNAGHAEHVNVSMPGSGIKQQIAEVLKDEGYIKNVSMATVDGKPQLTIDMKYHRGRPVIESVQRVSKPGRRVYRQAADLPSVSGGLGIAIISTSQGIMTARSARKIGIGGEVICTVT